LCRAAALTSSLVFSVLLPPHPTSTLFPYTTLFRSHVGQEVGGGLGCFLGVEFERDHAHAGDVQFHLGVGHVHFSRVALVMVTGVDRKSTRLNSSHVKISYAVFCLKKKNT